MTDVRAPRIFTIGHSTRALIEFVSLLREFGITRLMDIRIAPGSRRVPHFASDALSRALGECGITYVHLQDLGGRRRPRPDSPHIGWRSASFRGYADHMESTAFRRALDQAMADARRETVALMCAEAVPWRCHRQLVADILTVCGFEVAHILGAGRSQIHNLTPFARVSGLQITYDAVGDLFQQTQEFREMPQAEATPEIRTPGRRRTAGRRGRPM